MVLINYNVVYLKGTTNALVQYLSFFFSPCSQDPGTLSLLSVVPVTCL